MIVLIIDIRKFSRGTKIDDKILKHRLISISNIERRININFQIKIE